MHSVSCHQRTAFLFGLAAFAFPDHASAYTITKLTHLDGANIGDGGFVQSINGGTPFLMKTDGGLSMAAPSNIVTMKSSNLKNVDIPAPALSDDDAFYSSTAQGHLGYTTPSALTLFSNFPKAPTFYELNRYDWPAAYETTGVVSAQQQPLNPNYVLKSGGLIFDLSILSDQGKIDGQKSYMTAAVVYREDYTPQLIDILPNIVWAGAPITLALEARNCHIKLPAGLPPFHYNRIDGISFDTTLTTAVDTTGENMETERLPYGLDFLHRYVGNNKPTKKGKFELSFTRFGKPTFKKSANHCNWAGNDCWNVRVHPRIDSISASSGFLLGGQTLVITGHGLTGTTKTVTVDGVECYIEEALSSDTKLYCTTGKKASASTVGTSMPGQPGIKYSNGGTPVLTTAMETIHPNKAGGDKKTHVFEGWFKAPETGEYRFFCSADDSSRIEIDSVNAYGGAGVTTLVKVAENTKYELGYRNWNLAPSVKPDQGNYRSEWIQLTGGKYYPFKAVHVDGGGGYHFSSAVEFKANALNHPHATRAIQNIRIEQTHVAESWSIEILNPNADKFRLGLKTANMAEYWYTSDGIPCNSSPDKMASLIQKYFEQNYKSGVWVVLTMYDAAGAQTQTAADSKKNVYVITTMKRITGVSFTAFTVTPFGAITPKITVKGPEDVTSTQSSTPLAGKMVVSCTDNSNVIYKTRPLSYNADLGAIHTAIHEDIPFLHGRVSIQEKNSGSLADKGKFLYYENGRNIYLLFDEVDYNPKQCAFESDVTTPLTGNTPTFPAQTDQAYGTGKIFTPIGLDFLYTSATKPQVLVSIDSLQALCVNLNCDYEYVASASQVTQQAYDSSTKVLTITGTALPTTGVTVTFGGVGCADSPAPTYTETQIQCTLASKPRAGSLKVEVRTSQGLIPVANGLTAVTVALVVSTVSPTSINDQGGDTITVTGSGFPLDPSFASVKLSDGALCVIQTISETQIVCKFKKTTATSTSTVNVEVFNYDYYSARRELRTRVPVSDTATSLTIVKPPQVSAIDKSDVSPVLKQTLTFTLTGYNDTLLASQLKIILRNDAGYIRDLYIMSVDDAQKKVTVKFNGAPIGSYHFQFESNSPSKYGMLDTTPITFKTSSTITNISPTSGSILGGTLITITGTNFSTTLVDQAVTITVNPLLYIYCDILTATTTELTCRVRKTNLDPATPINNVDVIVVLAASTESNVVCVNSCKFSFVAPVATVTSLTAGYDAGSKSLTYTLAGTGFTAGNTGSVSLFIDGVKQTTASVDSATSAVFRITDVKNTSSTNVAIYFADGSPTGYLTLTSLSFDQKFLEITPSTGGSEGGTLLTVKGTGFGINTTGLGLKNINTSASLCKEVKVTGYGVFTCFTNALPVQSSHVIKMVLNANEIACEGASCSFEQLKASSPEVTAVALSAGNVLTFTGTGFPAQADYTLKAYFKSAEVTISSWTATEAVATFTNGIPASVAADNAVPQLKFTRKADSVILIAYSTGVTLTNTVTISAADSTTGITGSFAGGLSYTVTKANVYASLLEAGNSITVCGNPCPLDLTLSNASKVVCKLPKLTTTFSATTYKITDSGPITGTWTAKVQDQVQKVTDNVWPSEYTDPSAGCFIEVTFTDSQVGVLDSAKILINNLNTNKAPFSGKTKLQGWDGSAYVDILTLSSTINEGWNTFEWAANKPAYSKYRWYGTDAGGCRFGEVKYFGIIAKSDTNTSVTCTPKILIGGTSTDLSPVTYSNTATPTITQLSQRYGNVTGGETLTITGTNFVDAQTTVTIDKIACATTSITSTQIVCTLGQRVGDQPNPSLNVFVTDKGLAANQGHTFRYVQYWSEPSTWGGDAPPQFGEAVSIPVGRTLLVNVDSVPQLSFILVEGALIFAPHPTDPTHQRTFDAGYIFINGGYMEVGTEANPYTSKITITMHGDVTTPAIPVYGNKNIAVRKGELHLVGKERKVTWTLLDKTAEVGATTITLQAQTAGAFDWAVGEQIVIASTSYVSTEAETRRITTVGTDPTDALKPVLTLDSPLKFRHFAQTVSVGASGDSIDMRAEVGLLTRNVKYQGDPETSPKNQYGAHIMLHFPQDESCIGRILYVELFNVGQAFKLGRYPIHFHIIGTVSKSLVKGNAIHQTYNRAVTIHNVKYFNIVNNVVYNTMGHSIFIEDAIETNNVIDRNLVIMTKSSFSLLNTDQTPASFWITHPDNVFTNNRAAGSERYGFWFDLQDNPINGSFTPSICPKNAKLGEFRDNVAHSNGRYGLRIFHSLAPRERPCDAWTYDNSNPAAPGAPFPSNPAIPAVFENFTGWKNVRTGAIGESLGAVEWKNFKVADNGQSQLEVSSLDGAVQATSIALINKALVIGRTVENGAAGESTFGIVGPRANFFTITDSKFYNIKETDGALGDCSHCEHSASTDSGARTIFTSKLTFDASVKRKVQYRTPFKGIFSDMDGTLTGRGANSWAMAYFRHNEWANQCTRDEAVFNGHICGPTVQVRRIAFSGMSPASYTAMNMKILQYDAALLATMGAGELQTYKNTAGNYSIVNMKAKLNPNEAWTAPYVMGHKYRIFWDQGQIDYKSMTVQLDQLSVPSDNSVVFNMPFIGNYEAIDFIGGNLKARDSLTNPDSPSADWITGFNNWSLDPKELNFVINANNGSSKTMVSNMVVCREKKAEWCLTPVVIVPGACEGEPKNWSDATAWITDDNPAGGVPVEGQTVTIPIGKNIVFDLAESPIFKRIVITGCLQFLNDNSKDLKLQAESIYIMGGKFNIGSAGTPFARKATITLHGDQFSDIITMDTEQNTKSISNIGIMGFYGKPRSLMGRLLAEAQKGATALKVTTGLDWVAGDVLGFAPTAVQHLHSEEAIVQSYNAGTGDLVITSGLKFYHFGAATSDFKGADLRGEVFLLSRNVLIEGSQAKNTWNGVVVTADLSLLDLFGKEQKFSGISNLEWVELKNMGQDNNQKAALNFWNSLRTAEQENFSSVKGISIHMGRGWGIRIENSQNITFKDSVVFQATQIGVNLKAAKSISAENVNIIGVKKRQGIVFNDMLEEIEGCLYGCTFTKGDICTKVSWTNSIIAGCPLLGMKVPAYGCADTVGQSSTNNFGNNLIHSVEKFGAWVLSNPGDASQGACLQISDMKFAKCGAAGLAIQAGTAEIRVSNMVVIDNKAGISVMVGSEGDSDRKVLIKDSFVFGDSILVPKDCPSGDKLLADECTCNENYGILSSLGLSGFNDKDPMKIKADGNWATKTEIKNVNFIDYRSTKSTCGARQFAIANNSGAADNIPVQSFTGAKFTDCVFNAIIFINDPNPGWAKIDDCGNFPCTAPFNAIYNFYDTIFESPTELIELPSFWVKGTTTKYSFQVVANAKQAAPSYPNATLNGNWNAWLVADPAQTLPFQVGHLYFESLDGDSRDRSVQPVIITNPDGYSNTLNSFMDHGWDGFYTSQKRTSRFPAQVLTNKFYTVQFTGTPPNNMRFKLTSDVGTKGIIVKIPYPNAGSYSVRKGNDIVMPLNWGEEVKLDNAANVCGTNRYIGVQNFLEFYLTPGCTLNIIPRDAILVSVRLQWTLNEFFTSGETTFTQRLAAVLGIDISRVKVVAAYNGSLNMVILINDDASKQTFKEDGSMTATAAQLSELNALNAKLLAAVSSNNNVLGAPVLEIVNTVKSSAIVNVAISQDTIIQTQIGGALQNLGFSVLALFAGTLVLFA